jgi:hypothetical protein
MCESSTPVPSSVFNTKKNYFLGIFLFVQAALLHPYSWHASGNKNKQSSASSDKAVTIRIYKLGAQVCDEMFFSFVSLPKNMEEDKTTFGICMSNKEELLIQLFD